MVEVDARGLSCPEPVMHTLKAMKANPGETIEVYVSDAVPRDNVEKMAKKRGKNVVIDEVCSDYKLTIS